jgi:iron complex outermembrane receptor protein
MPRRSTVFAQATVIACHLSVTSWLCAQTEAEVVVRGDQVLTPSVSSHDANIASSIIRRDRLSTPGVEAADVLRELPGAQVMQTGGLGAPATLSLRGANNTQTAAVMAGARLDDELTGITDLSLLPLWFVNRIEVFRGAAPFDLDRVLPGGVLVLEPRYNSESQGRARFEVGSFGERAASVIASSGDETLSVTAGLRAAASDDDYPFPNHQGLLLSPGGPIITRRANADFSSRDVWLAVNRCTAKYTLEVIANQFEREQGVPKLGLLPTVQSRGLTNRDLAAVRLLVNLDRHHQLEALSNVLHSSISLRDPLTQLDLLAQRVDVDTWRSTSSLAVLGRHDKKIRWRISLAAEEARLTRVDAADAALSAPPDLTARRNALRLAGATEVQVIGPFGLHAQAVSEATSERAGQNGNPRSDAWLTGRAGLHMNTSHWQVWLNATRAARPPSLGERYGESTSIHGNPNLKPEQSIGFELAGRWSPNGLNSRIWFDGASFVRWTDDAILLVSSDQKFAVPYNLQGTRVAGIEGTSGARLVGGLESEIGATLLDARQTQPAQSGPEPMLPFQSRLTTHAVLRLRNQIERKFLRSFIIEARFNWQSNRAADLAGNAILPAQSSLDLEAAWLGLFGALDARLRVANVFDVPRFDLVGYPLPGRSVHASLEVPW